jgi:hypothetical protein
MNTPSEWTDSENPKDRRARVLSRLALTRADFVAQANIQRAPQSPSLTHSALPAVRQSIGVTLLTSPNAEIVAALLVGSVIFGPRRLIAIAAMPILRFWLTRTIRSFSAKATR